MLQTSGFAAAAGCFWLWCCLLLHANLLRLLMLLKSPRFGARAGFLLAPPPPFRLPARPSFPLLSEQQQQ